MYTFLIFLLVSAVLPDYIPPAKEQPGQNWQHVDYHVLNTPPQVEREAKRLAGYFLEVAVSDAEKARAVYRWITNRIRFDTETFFSGNPETVTGPEVLQSRKAVCSGFTVLFKELARAMDLKTRVIVGHSKGYGFEPGNISDPPKNHSWIAVQIEDDWQLIDPTWGAGYIREGTEDFTPAFSEFYFLVNPEHLVYTHFPFDDKWQLLEQPLSKSEYLELPMLSDHFFQMELKFDKQMSLYNDTEGKFSTRLTIPENIVVRSEITHIESGQTENSLIRFKGKQMYISAILSRTGRYKLELFARERDDKNELFYRVAYLYLDNAITAQGKLYPEFRGYYETSRASLESPLRYELADTVASEFKITIPGAEEAYVINSAGEWHSLERSASHFRGSVVPGRGKIMLVARLGENEFYSVMVKFEGVRE